MQEQKKDYRTIAIKAMKVACAVLAVAAMLFVLNALLSIDWKLVGLWCEYNGHGYADPLPPKLDNGMYMSKRDFFDALKLPLIIDSAKKALYCLVPTPVLYAIATLMEKKK